MDSIIFPYKHIYVYKIYPYIKILWRSAYLDNFYLLFLYKKSLFVKKCVQNYILTNLETVDYTKEYSCLQFNKNIEISGSIH